MKMEEFELKDLQKIKVLVLKWLTRRAFFEAEIEYRLKKIGVSESLISAVTEFCRELKLFDDEKLKERIIEKELKRGRGKAFAMAKCSRWVDTKENNLSSPETKNLERDAIRTVIEKKKIDLASLDRKEKQKLFRFFLQRGFARETVTEVLFASVKDSSNYSSGIL